MIGGKPPTIMYDPEAVKFEWPELDEEKIIQDAQKKLEDHLKIEALEYELKEATQRINHYIRVLNVLQESGAVTPVQVRKAHELLNEVGK